MENSIIFIISNMYTQSLCLSVFVSVPHSQTSSRPLKAEHSVRLSKSVFAKWIGSGLRTDGSAWRCAQWREKIRNENLMSLHRKFPNINCFLRLHNFPFQFIFIFFHFHPISFLSFTAMAASHQQWEPRRRHRLRHQPTNHPTCQPGEKV